MGCPVLTWVGNEGGYLYLYSSVNTFNNFIYLQQKQSAISNMEVLNRLCDFGDESDRRAFLEKLFQFMEDKGSPITVVPAISKTPIDLYRLYHLVKDRGGLWEVIILFLWSVECLFIGTPPTPFLRIELSKNNSCYLASKFSLLCSPKIPVY